MKAAQGGVVELSSCLDCFGSNYCSEFLGIMQVLKQVCLKLPNCISLSADISKNGAHKSQLDKRLVK